MRKKGTWLYLLCLGCFSLLLMFPNIVLRILLVGALYFWDSSSDSGSSNPASFSSGDSWSANLLASVFTLDSLISNWRNVGLFSN